jgi:hypothetical protein
MHITVIVLGQVSLLHARHDHAFIIAMQLGNCKHAKMHQAASIALISLPVGQIG